MRDNGGRRGGRKLVRRLWMERASWGVWEMLKLESWVLLSVKVQVLKVSH